MTRNQRKIRRFIFKNLDKIYLSAKEIAEEYDSRSIPLTTLKEIINRSKPDQNTGVAWVDDHNGKYNKTLDSLYVACKKNADRMHSKKASLRSIKEGIRIIKSAYKEGQKD